MFFQYFHFQEGFNPLNSILKIESRFEDVYFFFYYYFFFFGLLETFSMADESDQLNNLLTHACND